MEVNDFLQATVPALKDLLIEYGMYYNNEPKLE